VPDDRLSAVGKARHGGCGAVLPQGVAQPHTANPRTITVDKNAAYPKAAAEMKKDGELWRRSRLRQLKYLNNIVEQDHQNVKRLTRPGLGFVGFWTARRTLAD
jgi:IS6 family transposase